MYIIFLSETEKIYLKMLLTMVELLAKACKRKLSETLRLFRALKPGAGFIKPSVLRL